MRQRIGDDEERLDESREQAGEKSLRPDIQAGGAAAEKGGEPPEEHEHPSDRETSDDDSADSQGSDRADAAA